MRYYDESLALFLAGRDAEGAGKLAEARDCFCRAVAIEPENASYIRAMAHLSRRMGREEDASLLFAEAIEAERLSRSYPNARLTALVCESLVA